MTRLIVLAMLLYLSIELVGRFAAFARIALDSSSFGVGIAVAVLISFVWWRLSGWWSLVARPYRRQSTRMETASTFHLDYILPQDLHPLSWRHYGLVLLWCLFQPSLLRAYLNRETSIIGLRKVIGFHYLTIKVPRALYWIRHSSPYRKLCVMSGFLSFILFVLWLGLMAVLLLIGFRIMPVAASAVPILIASGITPAIVVVSVVIVIAIFPLILIVVALITLSLESAIAVAVAPYRGHNGGISWALSRVIIHSVERLWSRWMARSTVGACARLERHPAYWDENLSVQLTGTDRMLYACLVDDLDRGLRLSLRLAANESQRWVVRHALTNLLSKHPDPLGLLYHLIYMPAMAEPLIPLTHTSQAMQVLPRRLVLLHEIARPSLTDTTGSDVTRDKDNRNHVSATYLPLSAFGAMLYEIDRAQAELESLEIKEIRHRQRFELIYEGIREFPHGDEVASSFATIAAFLDLTSIDEIGIASQQLDWVGSVTQPLLRPTVIEALKALGDISNQIRVYERTTSLTHQFRSLSRVSGALNELAAYVHTSLLPPEQVLLKRIVQLWQSIVAKEQGKLGELALRTLSRSDRRSAEADALRTSSVFRRPPMPFSNPYIVGDPVRPPLFVGRDDVLGRFSTAWSAKADADSIILYGHRRMGKSSILRSLDQIAPQGSVIVYADMAGETSLVESAADLLLGLADKIYVAVRRAYPDTNITQPESHAYTTPAQAKIQFDRFMEQVHDALAGHGLILALDEFEAIERAVEAYRISKEIYQFLRAQTQEPWITLVFGGLHTLDEMSRDYQQPFYGSYENIRVSYLGHNDAWKLITNPTPDFDLNYEPEAVERIIAETGRQPYLVQLVCRDALDHLNHELFDENKERDVLITLSDVEAVLGPDFFRRGTVYFDGVWTQTSDPAQRKILRVMAQRDEPWTLADLEKATGLDLDILRQQLRWAERHDILREIDSNPPTWQFWVPLMRRWIREFAYL